MNYFFVALIGMASVLYCYLQGSLTSEPFLWAAGLVVLFFIAEILFKPLDYRATHDQFQSGATRRRPGNIPPVYPNGWYVHFS